MLYMNPQPVHPKRVSEQHGHACRSEQYTATFKQQCTVTELWSAQPQRQSQLRVQSSSGFWGQANLWSLLGVTSAV